MLNNTNIYLDIDGVLLANESYAANYAADLIKYLVSNYEVTWLTTHVMNNDPETAVEHIGHLFDAETVECLKKIRKSSWSLWKTEAIDFSKPFIWLDDDCYPEEQEVLKQHKALSNWVEIDLYKDPDQLQKLLESFPVAVQPIL